MYHLQRFRVFFIQINACDTGIVHLLEEFFQICTTFMPYPGFREQTTTVTSLKDTDTEINVFAKTHGRESSQCFVHLGTDSHIETTGIEFIHFLLAASYTSGGKKRSHGIINGLLYIRKRIMGTIRTSKRICRFPLEFCLHRGQIGFGQDTIRIQNQQILSATALCRIVACLSGSRIRFLKIVHIQRFCILVHHLLAWNGRTVFHDHHFKVSICLTAQTLQQLIHFIRAVVHRNHHRILRIHLLSSFNLFQLIL